jgi:hypothetical protein
MQKYLDELNVEAGNQNISNITGVKDGCLLLSLALLRLYVKKQ